MAVENCPDCKGKVSSTAPKCPHCGRLMKGGHQVISGVGNAIGNGLQIAFIGFILLLLIGLLAQCFGGDA
jgi:hypothetical protein